MASLIEELISVLSEENKEYQDLVILSREKTNVIVKGDIEYLKKITEAEENFINRITKLEKSRSVLQKDIATVLCRDADKLTVRDIIEVLNGQIEAKQKLASVYDELKVTIDSMVTVNELNRNLINQSLELINFDLNLLQGAYQEPETANYSKNAYNAGVIDKGAGVFDANQ